MARYLPSFRVADEALSKQITVRHLLAHTSGLSTYSGRKFFGSSDVSDSAIGTAVQAFSNERLLTEPGTGFRYSNSNYIILGAIIEAVTGRRFEDVIQKE